MQLGLEPSVPVTNFLGDRCREGKKEVGPP